MLINKSTEIKLIVEKIHKLFTFGIDNKAAIFAKTERGKGCGL